MSDFYKKSLLLNDTIHARIVQAGLITRCGCVLEQVVTAEYRVNFYTVVTFKVLLRFVQFFENGQARTTEPLVVSQEHLNTETLFDVLFKVLKLFM